MDVLVQLMSQLHVMLIGQHVTCWQAKAIIICEAITYFR